MERTYKVVIELEVTAIDESEALMFAIDDINELSKINMLKATIEVVV